MCLVGVIGATEPQSSENRGGGIGPVMMNLSPVTTCVKATKLHMVHLLRLVFPSQKLNVVNFDNINNITKE